MRRRYGAALGAVVVAVSLVSAPIAPSVEVVSHRALSYSVELELVASEISTAVVAAAAAAAPAAAAASPIGDLITGIQNFVGKIVEAIGVVLFAPLALLLAVMYTSGTSGGRCGLKCFLNGGNLSAAAAKVTAPKSVTSQVRKARAGTHKSAAHAPAVKAGARTGGPKPGVDRKASRVTRGGKAVGSSARVRSGK